MKRYVRVKTGLLSCCAVMLLFQIWNVHTVSADTDEASPLLFTPVFSLFPNGPDPSIFGEPSQTAHTSVFGSDEQITTLAENPVMQSLFIPGWGQYSQGYRLKGVIFATVAATAAIMAIYYNDQAGETYDRYQSSTDIEEIRAMRKKTERYDVRRNKAIIGYCFTYGINLVDIYYFSTKE